jgi:hypothetical protein
LIGCPPDSGAVAGGLARWRSPAVGSRRIQCRSCHQPTALPQVVTWPQLNPAHLIESCQNHNAAARRIYCGNQPARYPLAFLLRQPV